MRTGSVVTISFDVAEPNVYPLIAVAESIVGQTDTDELGEQLRFQSARIARGRVTFTMHARTFHQRKALQRAEAWVQALAAGHPERDQLKLAGLVVTRA